VIRHLLVFVVAIGLAVPGVISVITNVTNAPASPPGETLPVGGPAPFPTIVPTASPYPGDSTPPVTIASGMGSRWRNDTATVQFAATDDLSGVAATVYRVDGGAWKVGTEVQVRAPKDHSNDGEHQVEFYSVDNALNQEATKSVAVKIDTRPPHFAWKGLSPGMIRKIQPVTCRFTVDEKSGPVKLSYKVTDQYGYHAVSRTGLQRTAGARNVRLTPRYKNGKGLAPGVYRIQFTVRDEAGNVTVSKRRSFRNYRAVSGGVWRRLNGAGKRVALTFDDGGAGPWESMLDTFKRYGMHGTFFPLGPYVAASPRLARRTVAEGHGVGSHGWTHTDTTRQSFGQVVSELTRSEVPWWSAARATPVQYFRPPYGSYNGTTLAAARSTGFSRIMLWDVDPRDWAGHSSSTIASHVLSRVHSGAIVCLHLTPQTAAALPAILSGLRARGYKAVSLPELFRAAGYR
jgi:peptidoglycan/xylan/chitin deacetylase (PgdA/CDA1 family)